MPISEPAPSVGRTFATSLASSLSRLVGWAAGSHGRASFLLVVVCLLAFLPGFFSIPPIDRDESRFAQATKQMLESGNYVDIRFQEEARHKKPIGIHWLQVASVRAGEAISGPDARTSIYYYRLPSLLAAIGVVLLTYWTALVFVARRGAVLAALLMASCVLLGVEARLAKTDAVLVFTILAAFGALARVYMAPREQLGGWRLPAIFWTAMGAGILVKGPMAPLFVGITVLVLVVIERSAGFLKSLKPLPGLVWCLLLVLPWFVAIYYVTDGAFYQHAVGVDMLGKVTEGQEGHGAPPGTYLVAVWGTYWPGIVLAVLAAPFAWRARREKPMRFLLAWLVPTWIVFEIAATKLPHYVLPLYPAMAILIALAMEREALAGLQGRLKGVVWLWPVLGILLSLGLGAGAIWLGESLSWAVWPLLVLAVILLVLAARVYPRVGAEGAFLTAICGALVLYFTVYQLIFPQIRSIWISDRIAAIVQESGCPVENVASFPYREPSLVFLTGTGIQYIDPIKAADLLKKEGCALAFIGDNLDEVFQMWAGKIDLKFTRVNEVKGLAYNGGKAVTIHVYRSDEKPLPPVDVPSPSAGEAVP
ncbi:ArnT family glycosyltransferase [Xanthobacter sp. TB0136]|uniref:ArnT family glycosyltransferase n=1 Tax=Xanthobacter sp. TB0136 TaxID=3459177 RepID=UPI0040397188